MIFKIDFYHIDFNVHVKFISCTMWELKNISNAFKSLSCIEEKHQNEKSQEKFYVEKLQSVSSCWFNVSYTFDIECIERKRNE